MKKNNSLTSLLLTLGVYAGPVYILVALLQVFIRPGYDFTRHDVSLFSNGELGWIQISNFIITGLMTIAAAVGIKRTIKSGIGNVWGTQLLGLYGVGLIGAGIFVADPMNGFPPELASATTISTNGLMHFVSGSIGFIGLIAACFVFARRFNALKEKNWSLFSLATGIIFFASFFGIASGSQPGNPLLQFVTIGFWIGVMLGWTWISALCLKLLKQ